MSKTRKDVTDADGQQIAKVVMTPHQHEGVAVRVMAPDNRQLFNFWVKGGRGEKKIDFLVLDPYGDEILSDEIRERVFGSSDKRWTLAIDRQTGELHIASLYECPTMFKGVQTSTHLELWLSRFCAQSHEGYVIPPAWLTRLDELKSKKRPFRISVRDFALIELLDREIGFNSLAENMVVSFDFHGESLDVASGQYRTTSKWSTS